MLRKKMQSACLTIGISACVAGSAYAARPLYVDDVVPVNVGQFQVEAGVGYWDHPDCKHWDVPLSFRLGVLPRLDMGVGCGGQFEEQTEIHGSACRESGVGDMAVSAKWKALDEDGFLPAMALVPMVKFPTADQDKNLGSGETDYDLAWIASKTITDTVGAHVNIGYSWLGESDGGEVHDILRYGVAVEYRLVECFQWVGEVFAEQEIDGGASTAVQVNTGFRASMSDGLTFDVAVGSAIHGDAPDFTATAGLTWVFEAKEVQNVR